MDQHTNSTFLLRALRVGASSCVSRAGAAFVAIWLAFALSTSTLLGFSSEYFAYGASPALTLQGESTTEPTILPEYYDAREKNLISPVRLQDPWGACWAFGSLAAMEANLVKQGLATPSMHLSPRHLIYFAGTPITAADNAAQAGEGQYPVEDLVEAYSENAVFEMGGHAQEVASAISSGEGVALESAYPFRNNEGYLDDSEQSYAPLGTWALDAENRYDAAFGLRNMHRFPNPGTFSEPGNIETFEIDHYALDAIKQAILDYGAVSVSYCSFHGESGRANYYNDEFSSFFTRDTTTIDHDVCIVGWDDNFSRYNFTPSATGLYPEEDGAWIVKNSWGYADGAFPDKNTWGKDGSGYFYLSYCDRSATGFTAWEMMSLSSADATQITHQYDYMGQRSNAQTRVTEGNPIAYANIFTAQSKEKLRAVSVNTYAPETEVNISLYLLPEKTSTLDPTVGTLLCEQTVVCPWAGYHRIQLDKAYEVAKGQRFAVVVSMFETDAEGNRIAVASIEAGNNKESVSTFGLLHYDTVVCNAGETVVFATIDGKSAWIDGQDYAKFLQMYAMDSAYYGNACIKVFADPVIEPDPKPDPKPDPEPKPDPATEQDTNAKPDATADADPNPAPALVTQPSRSSFAAETVPETPSVRALANTADGNTSLLGFLLAVLVVSGAGVFRYRT